MVNETVLPGLHWLLGSETHEINLSDQRPFKPDIELWRARVEEVRAQAEQMTDRVCRSMMIEVAETYERLINWQLMTDRLR
jgi:hypothetical protein